MTGGKLKLWPMRSTTGPVKHSGGEHRRKCLPTNYTQAHDTVLRRPIESAQYTAIHYSETLMLEGLIPSIGTVGDALDNGLCETTIGLYKTECVREGSPFRTGPIRTLTDLENSTSAWVAWFGYAGDLRRVSAILRGRARMLWWGGCGVCAVPGSPGRWWRCPAAGASAARRLPGDGRCPGR